MLKNLMDCKRDELIAKLKPKITHGPTKGENSELHWREFFNSFLPSKYGITSGFVIDSQGGVSEQIDLIIYDSLYAPVMFELGDKKYIAVESVYAVFECKQELNKRNIEYANRKIKSVKKLYRTQRSIINAGVEIAPRELTPIIGGILGRHSSHKNTLGKHIKSNDNINFGCAIETTTFLVSHDRENVYFSNKEETIMTLFYIVLDELYKIGTVCGMDIREYSNNSINSFKFKEKN